MNQHPLRSRWQENINRWTGVSEPTPVKQYLLDERLIRLQERNRKLDARRKRVPVSDGSRYLVVNHQHTAVMQSNDPGEVLEYLDNHEGCDFYDLDDDNSWFEARQIGKYMAPRDREKAVVPEFNPDEGKAGRFGTPRESLLKDRKSVTVLPPPKDVTPRAIKLMNEIDNLLDGTPLIGQHNYTCKSCGYEATSCPCSRPMRRERDQEQPRVHQESSDLVSKKQTLTTAEFIAKIRREAGLKELV